MSFNAAVYRPGQLCGTKDQPGILPISSATLWRWVRDGRFPQPFKLGPKTTVFDKAAVDQWIAAQRDLGAK